MSSRSDAVDILAATFVIQALDIDADARELARSLNRIERDDETAVFAVQLDSSVGPAAFLVYVYRTAGTGHRSKARLSRYEQDLATLREAQEHDVPGPRLLATGELDVYTFILATDPRTFEALAEPAKPAGLPVASQDALADPAEVRRDAATKLIDLLREADGQAARWLLAVQSQDAEQPADHLQVFDEIETELALELMGPGGIRNILTVANRIIATARQSTGDAVGMMQSVRIGGARDNSSQDS